VIIIIKTHRSSIDVSLPYWHR